MDSNIHTEREPFSPKFSKDECSLMDQEVQKMISKGAIREAIPVPDQVISHIFLRPKRSGGSTRVQPQESQRIHRVPTLQNGEFERCLRHDKTRGLYGPVGPKRRVFQHSNMARRAKASTFLGGETIRMPSNGVWVGPSTQNIHEGRKASSIPIKENGNTSSNLSGRFDYSTPRPKPANERFEDNWENPNKHPIK